MQDLLESRSRGATGEGGELDLEPGTRVEVRSRYDRAWSRGFEVVERSGPGYRLRRLSDGRTLPIDFDADDVRQERKRGTWWY